MSKKNPHIGGTLKDFIQEEKTRDPEFAEVFDRLQLARALRMERKRRNVTQVELAKRIGTTQSSVARVESGRGVPKLDFLQRVAAALGMRLEVKLVSMDPHREAPVG